MAYWIGTGKEPRELHVRHRCDNPPCVNPDHLLLGTHAENMADKVERGRATKPGLKLSDEQAEEIRQRYAAGERVADLQQEFGISQQQTSRIISGRTRKLNPVVTERSKRGLRTQRHKLTDAQRAEICERFAAGESNADLSREFQVSSGYIAELVHGRDRDRTKRGRKGGGSSSRKPKKTLTPEQIQDVRRRWQQGGVTQRALADEFGVDPSAISRMVTGMSHRDVI